MDILSLTLSRLAAQAPLEPDAIMIEIDDPLREIAGLADVLIGSLGLTGVIAIIALVIGLASGWLVFWVRSRREPEEDDGRLRL